MAFRMKPWKIKHICESGEVLKCVGCDGSEAGFHVCRLDNLFCEQTCIGRSSSYGHGRGYAPALLELYYCCSCHPPAPSPLTLLCGRHRRRCSQSSPRLALCGNGNRSHVARLRYFYARRTYHVPRSPSRRPALAISI